MKFQLPIILLFLFHIVSLAQQNGLKSLSGIVEGKAAIEGGYCFLK
jgi:hypothetical protein